MIFSQNRESIEQIGEKIYISKVGEAYQILNKITDKEENVLGEYEEQEKASEVLKTIFQYIRTKKESYCMPEIEKTG